MAAGILAGPGTEYGPCAERCQHVDCRATRSQAATLCTHCSKPIGYGTRFYSAGEGRTGLDHALCVELEVEAKAAGQAVPS